MHVEIDWHKIESLWIHTSVNLVSRTSGGAVVNRCYIYTILTCLVMKSVFCAVVNPLGLDEIMFEIVHLRQ